MAENRASKFSNEMSSKLLLFKMGNFTNLVEGAVSFIKTDFISRRFKILTKKIDLKSAFNWCNKSVSNWQQTA